MTPRAPLTLKVPAVVAAFMLIVAAFISERVLSRLEDIQRSHLQALTRVHLDGLATALVEPVLREDVWETFAILDRAREAASGMRSVETVVTLQDGRILAATDPHRFPTTSVLTPDFPTTSAAGLIVRETQARAYARRDIQAGGRTVGAIHSELDIASLIEERRSVLWTLVLSNGALSALLVGIAWITVRRMLRPVRILARHLETGGAGTAADIPADQIAVVGAEFQQLYTAFNRLALGHRERESLSRRLAEEERLASLGRLASGMAHEINNPLGVILGYARLLKRKAERELAEDLGIIEEEAVRCQVIVEGLLDLARPWKQSPGPVDLRELCDGIVMRLRESHQLGDICFDVEGRAETEGNEQALRQVLLNLIKNAAEAAGPSGRVKVHLETSAGGAATVSIADSGPGLTVEARERLFEAFFTTKPHGTGLGLAVSQAIIQAHGGNIEAESEQGGGAVFRLHLPLHTPAQAREV